MTGALRLEGLLEVNLTSGNSGALGQVQINKKIGWIWSGREVESVANPPIESI